MMLWPYLFLILAIVSVFASVSLSGIFVIATVACFLLFILMTLRTFQKYGLLR